MRLRSRFTYSVEILHSHPTILLLEISPDEVELLDGLQTCDDGAVVAAAVGLGVGEVGLARAGVDVVL